jgi:hypothetical protein
MSYISDLDDALRENGEDIILRRIVGTKNVLNNDVTVRAMVRRVGRDIETLVAGVKHDDLEVVMSPTQILEAQWPGGVIPRAAPFNPDEQMPRRGDRLIVKGRIYRVEAADHLTVGGEVVRIELLTLGGASDG